MDILVYRIGFTTQDIDESFILKARIYESLGGIFKALGTTKYQGYLTGQEHDNYRYQIYPEYKANRGPKPKNYQAIRDILIIDYGADVINGMEADDALGINQSENTIIVSIDKDLDQVPGWHYNFVKGIKYYVEPLEGCRNFYKQLLQGDRIDNIPGLKGVGPKTAEKWLKPFASEKDFYEETSKRYRAIFADEATSLITRNGQLLKIRRTKDEPLWTPPQL